MAASTSTDDSGTAAWGALLRCHAAAVHVISDEVVQRTGVPLSWYDVLLELRAAEGGRLRMRELGERVVLSRTRVSRLVDEMTDAGYVTRVADPEDRRSSFATITAKGEREFRRVAPTYVDAIRRHFADHLTERERSLIRRALERVVDALSG